MTDKDITTQTETRTPDDHDRANAALGFRFVRALAVEKAALDRNISHSAVRVLATISYFLNSETGRAWPGFGIIADVSGLCTKTIQRSIAELKAAGFLFTERRSPITGGRALVHYGLTEVRMADIDEAVTAAVETLKAKRSEAEAVKRRVPKPGKPEPSPSKGTALSDLESRRPQCRSVDAYKRTSPPAGGTKRISDPVNFGGVRNSDPVNFVPSDPVNLVPSNPIDRTLSEVRNTKGVVTYTTAARESDTPPRQSRELASFSQGSEVAAGVEFVAAVLAQLGIATPSKAQRDRVADTITKAALWWKGMGCSHTRYQSFGDWFVGEWISRLRPELDKLADDTAPRRFTIDLEKQICFGSGEKKIWLTKASINVHLEKAEERLGGTQTPLITDFEAVKDRAVSKL